MITTKLLKNTHYYRYENKDEMKHFPTPLLKRFNDDKEMTEIDTPLDWEINYYLGTVKGQELIDIKYNTSSYGSDSFPKFHHFALVITDDHNHDAVRDMDVREVK